MINHVERNVQGVQQLGTLIRAFFSQDAIRSRVIGSYEKEIQEFRNERDALYTQLRQAHLSEFRRNILQKSIDSLSLDIQLFEEKIYAVMLQGKR